jgi:hypothetical protein
LKLATLTIPGRFRGPPASGNGGYVVGLLARYATGTCEVRLRQPPPLETPLEVLAVADDGLELRAGETLLASALPATIEIEVPPAPGYAAAQVESTHYTGFGNNPYPGCFVCGPAREPGDGLRIFAGTAASGDGMVYAAPWCPDPSLAGTRNSVRPEFMAAALDCPGYFAVATDGQRMLLGSMALEIERAVAVGEPCVVTAWSLGGGGRKWRAGTAIHDSAGQCVARAVSTWIALRD